MISSNITAHLYRLVIAQRNLSQNKESFFPVLHLKRGNDSNDYLGVKQVITLNA